MLASFFLPLVSLLLRGSWATDADPIAETPLGKVRGYTMTSRSGRQFLAFSGIPYAKPPVGGLRFKPPEPTPPWEGVKDARNDLPMCIQYNNFLYNKQGNKTIGIEDCLYLSVFTRNISGSAPVLFHIHGGAFIMGGGSPYGPQFLMDEDIVVVNINYRLGIYGFLTFETAEYPGNQGLKDQLLALRWVQENIKSFGGDPNLVTIIGESAGGASVYHHLVSPLSRGLFHRAVSESGTSYSNWALAPPGLGRANAEKLMTLLGCPKEAEQAMSCVRGKDPAEVVSKIEHFIEWRIFPFLIFGPVIESPRPDSFIVGSPSKWNHNPVPLLMGMTSAEGFLVTMNYLSKDFDFKWLSENYNRLSPFVLMYHASASKPDEITKEIRKFYLKNEIITMNDWVNLTMVATDGIFGVSVIDGANKHKGKVYFYYFDYIPKGNKDLFKDKKIIFGSNHCEEAMFLWNIMNYQSPVLDDPEDIKLSKALVKLLSNFMKDGHPILSEINLKWMDWNVASNNYVLIDAKGFHSKKGLLQERYAFWNSINYRDKMEK